DGAAKGGAGAAAPPRGGGGAEGGGEEGEGRPPPGKWGGGPPPRGGLAGERGAEKGEALAERRGARRHTAHVRHAAMTCPDAEHAASLRDGVHRRRRRGRDGGMTGNEVGHARREADARGERSGT